MRTIILFMRHEDHKDQILLSDAAVRARVRGFKIRENGFTIHGVVSSPLPRAITTAIAALEGYGNANVSFALEPRLGDFKTDKQTPAGALDKLKAQAKAKYGDDSDSSLAKAFMDTPSMHDLLCKRAEEGAEALKEIAMANQGKTILVTSHGVARMEIVLRYLAGFRGLDLLQIADELIARGEVVKVAFTFNDDDSLHGSPAVEPLTLLS